MLKEFKQQTRLLFTFSVSERRGILLLCVLLFLSLICYVTLPLWVKPDDKLLVEVSKKAEEWEKQQPLGKAHTQKYSARSDNLPLLAENKTIDTALPIPLFDPNRLTPELGTQLRLYPRQVKNILNYLNSGGTFKQKRDLKKLYSIDSATYARLEPFIQLPDTLIRDQERASAEKENFKAYLPKQKPIIELNTADSLAILSLPGIGPGFTKRILKLRRQLGGFYSTQQMMEVWGMTDSLYQVILPRIKVDPGAIQKIFVNEADATQLGSHPYIWKFHLANAIVNYRAQHGPYQRAEDLKKVKLLSDSLIQKLVPYLEFRSR